MNFFRIIYFHLNETVFLSSFAPQSIRGHGSINNCVPSIISSLGLVTILFLISYNRVQLSARRNLWDLILIMD